jgi:hypothetical protein
MVTQADFDGWCDWPAQAVDLDPVRKLGQLLMSRQVPLYDRANIPKLEARRGRILVAARLFEIPQRR